MRQNGDIRWRNGLVFISQALTGQLVGVAEHENGGHIVRFCGHDLGLIDPHRGFLRFAPPRARLRVAQETPVTTQ